VIIASNSLIFLLMFFQGKNHFCEPLNLDQLLIFYIVQIPSTAAICKMRPAGVLKSTVKIWLQYTQFWPLLLLSKRDVLLHFYFMSFTWVWGGTSTGGGDTIGLCVLLCIFYVDDCAGGTQHGHGWGDSEGWTSVSDGRRIGSVLYT